MIDEEVITLAYHDVCPGTTDSYTVTPSLLDEHVKAVSEIATIISPVEALNDRFHYLSTSVGKPVVMFTFDDAYVGFYNFGRKVLLEHDVRAVLFVSSSHVGKNNRWNPRAQRIIQHMDESQLLDCFSAGHVIGSHGESHNCLVKLDDDELSKELEVSKHKLESFIPGKVSMLAYPYGVFDDRVISISRRIYDLAFSTEKGASMRWSRNPYSISRISVSSDMSRDALCRLILANRRKK